MKLEREMLRGVGALLVLKLLSRRAMYGYELVQSVSAESEGVLAMGQSTLYPLLYNLESQGIIRGREQTVDNGRTRKYYTLTAKGKRRLAKDTQQWQAAASAMQNLGVLPTGLVIPATDGGLA